MKSTEPRLPRATTQAAADERFDQLREAFRTRLRLDGLKLMSLGMALTRPAEDFTSALGHIRDLAHRMRGAASIFDAANVLSVAAALEDATVHALETRTTEANDAVSKALEALMTCLSIEADHEQEDQTAHRRRSNASRYSP